jgi:hypothetical protein
MGLDRGHYERAFEAFVRGRRIPCLSVDDARKALLPGARGFSAPEGSADADSASVDAPVDALKSFDFVVYAESVNLLVDVKGRRAGAPSPATGRARLESWATMEDVRSLRVWERLFGPGFRAALVFVYLCHDQPPDGLFQEVVAHQDRWYALRGILLDDYRAAMKVRSRRWGTVDLPARDFERLSQPLSSAWLSRICPAAPQDVATSSSTPTACLAGPCSRGR